MSLNSSFGRPKQIINFGIRAFLAAMLFIYLIIFMGPAGEARLATESVDKQLLSFRNYGLYLRPQRSLRPINHRWTHTYVIDTPSLPPLEALQSNPTTLCSYRPTDSDPACPALVQFQRAIREVEITTYHMLNQSFFEFQQILHSSVIDVNSARSRRSWFDIIGRGMKVVFGVATTEDLSKVYDTIQEVRRSQALGFQTAANVTTKFASFMRVAQNNFDTIFNAFSTFNKMSDLLNMQLLNQRKITTALEQHLILILQQSVEFSTELYHISQFRLALQSALLGRITPDLIPPEVIKLTLNTIARKLSSVQTALFLVPQTPLAVYAGCDFSLWRDQDRLYVSLAFPISPLSSSLTLYQTLTTPVPFPQQPEHITLLQNLPTLVAYHRDHDLYLTFQSQPDYDSQSALFFLDQHPHVFHHRHERSCLSAFLNHDLSTISNLCTFAFMPNAAEPQIFHLQAGHLLLINISEYTLSCLNGSVKSINPPPFLEVILPCECLLDSQQGRFYPKLLQCTSTSESLTQIFPINRMVLQKTFTNDQISHISADSSFHEPPKVSIAKLQTYQSAYTKQINSLQKQSLTMDTLANATQSDATIFQSLAHKIAFDIDTNNLPITANAIQVNSWQNVLLMASTMGTVIALLGLFTLYRKYLVVIASLTLAKSASASNPKGNSDLSYLLPTTIMPTSTPSLIILRYDIPVLDILVCILILSGLLLLVGHWFKRQNNLLQSFVIYLEIANTMDRIHIPVITLETTSLLYTFQGTGPTPHIDIEGRFWPTLNFRDSPLQITYVPSLWVFQLPVRLPITWWQARKLRKIVRSPRQHLLIFFIAENHTFNLLPMQMENETHGLV